ncbi:MAG: AAA family ATPase [Deltaproteobacteria bacterium]|nr:AAA family ATPase [Deltaproteobacteria bacterium]
MRLVEIAVKNFRGIGATSVSISFLNSDIIFLIGKNNACKSTVLTAYEYLVKPKQKATLNDFHGYSKKNPIEIEAIFQKETGDEKEFEEKGLNKWVNSTGLIKFNKVWVDTDSEGQKSTYDPTINRFLEDGFGGFESHFKKHAPTPIVIPAMPNLEDLSKFVSETIKKTVLKKLSDEEENFCKNFQQRYKELKENLVSSDKLKKIEDQANENFKKIFPELEMSIKPVDEDKFDLLKSLEKEYAVTIKDGHFNEIEQDILSQGSGVIRQAMFNFLGLVKETIEDARKDFIILFEEPEIYLHPKTISLLKNSLYNLCYKSPFQVLCASHSPALIDLSKPHTSLARLQREARRISVYQAGDNLFGINDERKKMVQMNNRFNPHLCEIFFSDDVILVEGDTEAIVVRELLEEIEPTADIFVLNTGSKNNIPFFQEILTHFRIRQHIIHDGDDRYLEDSTGKTIFNKDGSPRKNSAWELNQSIWDRVVLANNFSSGLSHRYVHIRNFEQAHNYIYDQSKGKPLSAFEFAKNMERSKSMPIFKFVNQILGKLPKDKEFTPIEIEELIL